MIILLRVSGNTINNTGTSGKIETIPSKLEQIITLPITSICLFEISFYFILLSRMYLSSGDTALPLVLRWLFFSATTLIPLGQDLGLVSSLSLKPFLDPCPENSPALKLMLSDFTACHSVLLWSSTDPASVLQHYLNIFIT